MSGFKEEFEKKLDVWRGIERNITFTMTRDEMRIFYRDNFEALRVGFHMREDWESLFEQFIPIFNQMSNDDIEIDELNTLETSFKRLVFATFARWVEKHLNKPLIHLHQDFE